jgi:hypothetical protein
MMDEVLNNVFSRRWDDNLSKSIEKQLKDSLQVNIWDNQIKEYNWMVASAIWQYFKNIIEERNLKPIEKIVDAIVWKADDSTIRSFDNLIDNIEWKITEMIEDDYHRKADDIDKDYSIFATYRKKDWRLEVFCDSDMWEEKDNCYIRFLISSKTNSIFSISYWRRKENQVSKHLNALESYINNLYLSWTKIETINWKEFEDWDIELNVWSYSPY